MSDEQTGIISNSRGLFDAVHYGSGDIEVVQDTTKYMNGTALKTFEPQKQLFTTNWLPAGQLEGNVLIKVYWDTDDSDEIDALDRYYSDTASIRIYTNDDDTFEVLMLPAPFGDFGLRVGTKVIYNFLPYNSYKIEMWSELPEDGKYVTLDYIRLDELHASEQLNTSVFNYFLGEAEPVPITQENQTTVWGDDTSTLEMTFYFDIPYTYIPSVHFEFPTTTNNKQWWITHVAEDHFDVSAIYISNGTPTGVNFSSANSWEVQWSVMGFAAPPIVEQPGFLGS